MSTVEKEKGGTRLAAAEKVRAVEWLATRPKPIEAETMVAAAKEVSDALGIKLTGAVLQDILEASPSLAAKVVIGGGGAVAHLTAVVEALSTRLEAAVRLIDDLDLRLKSAVAHQEAMDHQVAGTLNSLSQQVAAVVDLQDAAMTNGRPDAGPSEAKGMDTLPGLEDSNDGSGSTV